MMSLQVATNIFYGWFSTSDVDDFFQGTKKGGALCENQPNGLHVFFFFVFQGNGTVFQDAGACQWKGFHVFGC